MFDFRFITLFLLLSVSISSHANQLYIFLIPSLRLEAPQVQRLELVFIMSLGPGPDSDINSTY